MVETIKAALRRVKQGYGSSSPLAKLLVVVAALALAALAAVEVPAFGRLEDWFKRASPEAQLGFLFFLALYALYSFAALIERGERVAKLKAECAGLRAELDQSQAEARGLAAEAKATEERLARLAQTENDIWGRPDPVGHPLPDRKSRPTRFVAMLNLKGGVGKTTVTANLAACLAMAKPPLRVLLVDLDFQGTLSNHCVAPELLNLQRQHSHTSARLLDPQADGGLAAALGTRMNRVPQVDVIVADDRLEMADFRAQAQFFLDPADEVRFRFHRLHAAEVYQRYDLVLFDCPPRPTTSAVNALSCSDYVVIPTKLDGNSIEAVPRTLRWMETLRPVTGAALLGVIANETRYYGSALVRPQQFSYEYLRDVVRAPYGSPVFEHTVRFSNEAVHGEPGVVGSADKGVRALFEGVAQEFRERLER
jgi:chromosome partitioning protein